MGARLSGTGRHAPHKKSRSNCMIADPWYLGPPWDETSPVRCVDASEDLELLRKGFRSSHSFADASAGGPSRELRTSQESKADRPPQARGIAAHQKNLRDAADAQCSACTSPRTAALPHAPSRLPMQGQPRAQPSTLSSDTTAGQSGQPPAQLGHGSEASTAPNAEQEVPLSAAARGANSGPGSEVRYGSFRLALSFDVCGPDTLPVLLGDPKRLHAAKDVMRVNCTDVVMLSSPSDSWPLCACMEDWALSTGLDSDSGAACPDGAACPEASHKGVEENSLCASKLGVDGLLGTERSAAAPEGKVVQRTGRTQFDSKRDQPVHPTISDKSCQHFRQSHAAGVRRKEHNRSDAVQKPRRPAEKERMACTDSVLLQNHSWQQYCHPLQPDDPTSGRRGSSGRDASVSAQLSPVSQVDESTVAVQDTFKPGSKPSSKFSLPPLTMPPATQPDASTPASGSTLKHLRYENEQNTPGSVSRQNTPCSVANSTTSLDKGRLPSIGAFPRQQLPQACGSPLSSPASPAMPGSAQSSYTSGFLQQLPQASGNAQDSRAGATSPNFSRRPGTRRRKDINIPVTPLNQGPFARPLTSPASSELARPQSSAEHEQSSSVSEARVPRIALRALRPTVAAAASMLSGKMKALSGRRSSSDADGNVASPRIDTASQLQDLAQLRSLDSGPAAAIVSPPGGTASPCTTEETLVSECSSKGSGDTQSTTDLV